MHRQLCYARNSMKLIFIYGPPAAGKLTIATELAKLTDFKLFHNHLTVPAVKAIFPEHGPIRTELLKKNRLAILEAAAKAERSTIFTLAYSGEVDNIFVGRIVQAVESHGGRVHFVELHAPVDTLMNRIGNDSRKQIGKISEPERLKDFLSEPGRDLFASVPYPDVLRIDTSKAEPGIVAQSIMQHFNLAN